MSSQDLGRLAKTPAANVVIDADLVHRLLQNQHSDLAHLEIAPVDAGWDNVTDRLGDRLAIRLPRRQAAAALVEHEQAWLPNLAGHLPIAVPTPCRLGTPALHYPWRWSILPWLNGTPTDLEPPHPSQAQRWGEFLRALHIPAPPNAPANPFRGVPLKQKNDAIAERLHRLAVKTDLITPTVATLWETALTAPIDTPATWLHGDLHSRNILVENGVITGVIDWGDMTSGDIATDLASLWMLFEDAVARQEAVTAYGGVSETTLQRARGWAIFF
ncbi:MAG: aminoglycoside phosphotransferase family protein, partial [Cyanobacteria bacterium J06638_6]